MYPNVLTVLIFLTAIFCINCQKCSKSEVWTSIPEDQYDRNVSSLNNGRPLGFMQDTILYDSSDPNPCYELQGLTNVRRVEIMAESSPPGNMICVKDQVGTKSCDVKLYECRQAVDTTVWFEFFCDASGCTDSDVTFWFRITASQPRDEMDPELWCQDRDVDEYPSSLIKPPDVVPPDINPTPSNDASFVSSFTIITFSMILLTSFATKI